MSKSFAPFLNPLFDGVEPGNASDLDDRDHLLLSLSEGEARKAGACHHCGTTNQFECLASIHCSLPGSHLWCRSLNPAHASGSGRHHY